MRFFGYLKQIINLNVKNTLIQKETIADEKTVNKPEDCNNPHIRPITQVELHSI